MKNFVRDATIHVSITFFDINENVVTPTGANVTLSYVPLGQLQHLGDCQRTFTTYALIKNPAAGAVDWIFDWDSSISEPIVVHGHAVTTTPVTPVSSVDFQFRLTANRANRELAGDDLYGSNPYG
jgi:hypothetical protein